jgi:hypothetical protein
VLFWAMVSVVIRQAIRIVVNNIVFFIRLINM